jgi:hypothetical protein
VIFTACINLRVPMGHFITRDNFTFTELIFLSKNTALSHINKHSARLV